MDNDDETIAMFCGREVMWCMSSKKWMMIFAKLSATISSAQYPNESWLVTVATAIFIVCVR